MLIPPRPVMPYWPAYQEPERSRIEAEYRVEEARWQREANHTILLNMAFPIILVLLVCAVSYAMAFVIPDALVILAR